MSLFVWQLYKAVDVRAESLVINEQRKPVTSIVAEAFIYVSCRETKAFVLSAGYFIIYYEDLILFSAFMIIKC